MAKIFKKIDLKKTISNIETGGSIEIPMAEIYYNSLTAALTRECKGAFSEYFSTDSKTKPGHYIVTRLK